jgi:hypothetical protein
MLWLGVNYACGCGGSDGLVVVIEVNCGGGSGGSSEYGPSGGVVVVVIVTVVIVVRMVSVVRCDVASRRWVGVSWRWWSNLVVVLVVRLVW